jgi:prevent-host-death family protein
MKEIGAFEAKNRLGHLLNLVENGEEIIITRHGKQVARLVRPEPSLTAIKPAPRSGGCVIARSRSNAGSRSTRSKSTGMKAAGESGPRQLGDARLDPSG